MMEMCMLAVFNSEHNVGDNEDMSSEVARRKMHVESQVNTIMWMCSGELALGSWEAGFSWGPHMPQNCIITYFMAIFVFYSLIQIQ